MCWYGRLYDIFLGTLLRKVRQSIARRINSRGLFPVLDICCGTGDQLRHIGGMDHAAVGVDRDFSLLRYARSRDRDIPWICADAGSLPFRTSSFRCVILSFSLHEKPPGFRLDILKEAQRVVRRGGRLIFLDYEQPWNLPSHLGSILIWTIEALAGGDHFRFFRDFMAGGGLRQYLKQNAVLEEESRPLEWGTSRIVISRNQKPETD